MKANIFTNASVYVGTYGKYNNGSISGKWLDLTDYGNKEEFEKACGELHKDESDPEFMFQDFQYIPDTLVSESWISPKVWDLIEMAKGLDDTEAEAFETFINIFGYDLDEDDPAELLEGFRERYQGEYDSEQEFAHELAGECCPEIETSPFGMYFDYGAFCRDLFLTDYTFDGGFVFRTA